MNTNMDRDPLRRFSEYVYKAAEAGTLVNLVFSGATSKELLKIKGVIKVISGARVLQMEFFRSEGRVSQENISFDEQIDALLASTKEDINVKRKVI